MKALIELESQNDFQKYALFSWVVSVSSQHLLVQRYNSS